jgi:hypothetical protein
MQPISDMPGDDFMKLQSLYAADLPINAECTLEDARQVLNWLLFEAPKAIGGRYASGRHLILALQAVFACRSGLSGKSQLLTAAADCPDP